MGEDIVTKYSSSLADLKMNSKPQINLLTMMAEDYIRHAPTIVQVIERHLTTVRPEVKLPVLYLIDSIIKNVKKDYVELFTQNIVSTFCGVFEKVSCVLVRGNNKKVDEKTRGLLWKLRGTWSDYFPTKKLYAIDVRCHQLDPKWPIMAQAPSSASIHVNPRFLNRGRATAAAINPEQLLAQTSASTTPELDDTVMEVQMRAQLLAKQKELLELQTKKVELELLQTKLQMEEKARRQKEEETTKQIDMAVKQEQMLVGMAEMAKNKTERIQQQLAANMHKPSSTASASSSIKGSPSSSKGHESSSDRETHSSFSKLAKSSNEASASSVDNSPTKKSKSSRDRDRRDRGKNDKSKESRHDSKEKDKESRHRHRDKDRHADNKEKDKGRHERSRDPASTTKAGGEWKDYHEAKKVSINKRVYRKSSGVDSDEENEDIKKDLLRKQSPSPPLVLSPTKIGATFRLNSDDNEVPSVSASPTKSPQPFSHSGESSSMSSGVISPLKRKLPKEKSSDRKSRDKSDKNKEKPVLSDPRLRKRHEKQKSPKSSDEINNSREETRVPAPKTGTEWKDYRERQQAVLRRTYRKNTGIDGKEESSDSNHLLNSDIVPGDVDLRFEAPMDLDLRTVADANGTEPPAKKSRSGKDAHHNTIDDLFGHQDVDLRANSNCWTQVKIKSENDGDQDMEDGNNVEDELPVPRRETQVLRSPGPPSPATSISSNRSTCDPLGRPLIYNRLPNDPEERKRSLDSRSTSVDPVEQFRAQHIDRALRSTGNLSETDMKSICLKAKEELDLGLLNADQYFALMKQIVQINEASAMREVQQMQQMKGGSSWQSTATSATPNPWMTETESNNIWGGFCPAPRPGPTDFAGTIRFPGPNTWEPSGDLPWMAANMPPAPRGPNPFEEAIGVVPGPAIVDDLVPKAIEKDVRIAERDVGRPIPIDGIMRQVRFYRDTAIVMMGKMSDDPRELSFQKDNATRVVLINGKKLEVYLGETKKFDINRVPHTLKIGSPGRELYIDDRPYEMYFGGPPKKIFLDGRPHTFQLMSQAPQVSVGQVPRFDLVAGRVNLTIDAVSNVPVYLDEKLQKIDVCQMPVLLRFCSNFQTVTLNGRPFPTNFGARLPFTITLHGSGKHYFRFSAITPNLETAIQAFISANYGGDWTNERNNHFSGRGRGGPFRGAVGGRGGRGRPQRDVVVDTRTMGANPWVSEAMENVESSANVNPLDLLNNLFNTSNTSDTKNNTEQSHGSEHQSGANAQGGDKENMGDESAGVNVSDLVANLIKFGLLPAAPAPEASSVEPILENKSEEEEKTNDETSGDAPSSTQSKEDQETKKAEEPPVPAAPTIPPLPTVDVSFDENLKERRNIAIGQIFTGVQCSQCGLRFPPDQTLRYSQHLDWHFRKNRREKANARKALSRKWYYDLSDWIQFEEIEDLEERAASLFENQDGDNENDVNSPSAQLNPEDYTVLSSSHEGTSCPQCGESFESYFDEEREEWRLKNAKLDDCDGDKKLYHPNCYEDYLKSLVEESIVEDPEEEAEQQQEDQEADVGVVELEENEDKENVPNAENEKLEDDDEVLIIKEGKKEVVVMEIDIDDDDVEKNDTVNEIVNEENHSIDMERKTDGILIEKDDDIQAATSGIDDNALDNTSNELVQSLILIDEDSTFLPGLSDNAEGWVFGFASSSAAQRELQAEQEDTKIIYAPMKFDIPPIKIEPPDEEPITEESMNPDEFLSNLQPYLASSTRSPGGSEPMNVDLTEEDSLDAVDSGARLVNQPRTSIDGNLQHEESATLPFVPAPKIRINITGMDTTPCSSPKDKDKPDSPVSRSDEGTSSQEETLVKDNGNENNIISNNTEMNKDNPVDLVLTEEVKRLKPRLVGRKLTNLPLKKTGTEESGLCVIC